MTRIDSPVKVLSFTDPVPFTTTPSVGIKLPDSTFIKSSISISKGDSRCFSMFYSNKMMFEIFISANSFTCAIVFLLEKLSISFPTETIPRIVAEVSNK